MKRPGDPLTSLEAWSRAVASVAGEIATALARRRLPSAQTPRDWAVKLEMVAVEMERFANDTHPRQGRLL